MKSFLFAIGFALPLLLSCSRSGQKTVEREQQQQPVQAPVYFKVDPSTAGSIKGVVTFRGKTRPLKPIDMSEDPACEQAHHGKVYDESLVTNRNGTLGNVFVYVKSGLEGKTFQAPTAPVTIDQKGCWFHPRVMGIETGQTLQVTNSDPVTHNIHPLAQINREWNHSQGAGDPPLSRRFIKPEVIIRVKCNIHSWMHAFIGVLDHPYFAVTGATGTFEIKNLPPGKYVLEAWHETLGVQDQNIEVPASTAVQTNFSFKGE